MRSFTQSWTSILATSFAFLLAPLTAYQKYALSLCLFFANVGLSWKTGHYACVSLDHASASIRPDEGGLKLTEPDNWSRVPGGPHTAFWPTATEPEWQSGHLKATTWPLGWTTKKRKKNQTSGVNPIVAVNDKHKKEVKAYSSCNS